MNRVQFAMFKQRVETGVVLSQLIDELERMQGDLWNAPSFRIDQGAMAAKLGATTYQLNKEAVDRIWRAIDQELQEIRSEAEGAFEQL